MKHCKLLSIDLAKNIFQICCLDRNNQEILNRKVKRNKLLETVLQKNPKTIVMESCYSATYWGRRFQKHGFEVKLIPPQHVKPFVKGNKNDKHDALAIAEASLRPHVHFVPVKNEAQQEIQIMHRIRERYKQERTKLSNQLRGLLSDYGIIIKKGIRHLLATVPTILEDCENGLTLYSRIYFEKQLEEIREKTKQLKTIEKDIKELSKTQEGYDEAVSVPSIGDITASAIIARVGDGKQFAKARGMTAWLGIVPKHASSGEKLKMQNISKRGDTYLRTLLIHCGRVIVNRYKDESDPLKQFANRIAAKRGKNVAAVAVAHKLARIIWAVLTTKTKYDPKHAQKYVQNLGAKK